MSQLSPNDLRILVYTRREGVLKTVGHDLVLAFDVRSVSRQGAAVTATIDAASARVEGAVNDDGSVRSVSLVDRKVIERNARKDVLDAKRHPDIAFRGETAQDGDAWIVQGTLALRGVEEELQIRFEQQGEGWVGEAELHQPTWGIQPYTTMMGALKIQAVVGVKVLAPAGAFG